MILNCVLGASYFDHRKRQRTFRRCVETLQSLGHKVTLESVVP